MNRLDDQSTLTSSDKALNTRQKASISLILFGLFVFLLIPIHSVELADYSGTTFQEFRDEITCGVERCYIKVSIVDLWTCDYEVQPPSTNVYCAPDAKKTGTTAGILSISISVLLMAYSLKFFSEPRKTESPDYDD